LRGGILMDLKILAVAVVLIAFVGIAMAMPGFYNGFGKMAGRGNWSLNTTRHFTVFNATATQEFVQALMSGNYSQARQLHTEYGLGGMIFDKLNETTFAQYSQIYQLRGELRQELGQNSTVRPFMGRRPFRHGIRKIQNVTSG
jgi:hypothetical protein